MILLIFVYMYTYTAEYPNARADLEKVMIIHIEVGEPAIFDRHQRYVYQRYMLCHE